MTERQRVGAIVGATAVGKTEMSVEVAERVEAEIVSVDSMQVYRAMDAGTAKPDGAQRSRVPHHLIDILPPSHDVTVAEFQRLARAAIGDIVGRGKLPLLVGGSGLYYRAVVDDLRFPPRSSAIRRRLHDEASRLGAEALYARLVELDPDGAARIEPQNERRIVRALEVIELTGERFSANDSWDRYQSRYDLRAAGLTRERDDLFKRIARRVDEMLASGLVDEVRALRDSLSVTARQALGYRQAIEALERDDLASLRDEIVRATKRFARRQESWFRADPRIAWFDASSKTVVDDVEQYLSADGMAANARATGQRTVP